MKKVIILFYCLILLASGSACQKATKKVSDEEDKTDLGTYLKTAKLPKNLSIDFDPTEVKLVQAAKTYIAGILQFEENRVIKNLLRSDIVATNNYAQGPWYEAGDDEWKEYLTVYDGGKSVGMNSSVKGGITYSLVKDGTFLYNKLSMFVENAPGPPGNIAQEFGFNLKSDFGSYVNLSFKEYEDALSEIEDVLATIGFPEFSLGETYSLDLDMLLKHEKRYQESSFFGNGDDDEDYTWSKDDEAYLFFFRQVIDDIPLSNIYWQRPSQSALPEEVGATSISVFYSKEGIRDLIANDLLDVKKSVEEKTLISAVDALKNVIDSYSEILIEDKTTVFSMELYYVAILKSENSYELVPAWIFGIAETSNWQDERTGKDISLDSYSYYVLNAITGDRIEKASDIQ